MLTVLVTQPKEQKLTVIKKEKIEISFLQEIHLSRVEHEKLKKFGFRNGSHTNNRKREVAILMSSSIKFEWQN